MTTRLKDLLTKAEFAEALGISVRMVRALLKAGCPFIRIGREVRIDPEEARAWLQRERGTTWENDSYVRRGVAVWEKVRRREDGERARRQKDEGEDE